MASLEVKGADGKKKGKPVELPADIFEVEPNVPVMHRVVRAQRAAARSGTASTKTRAMVRGGGKKPWRQKGTGRARQGSIRAPQWTGGGVVFGPHPRDYSLRVNKKEKQLALRGALSDRRAGGNLHILDAFQFDGPKTREAVALLGDLGLTGRKVLVVLAGSEAEDAAVKSFRNLQEVHLLVADQLNTYDVLHADDLVFTRESLDAFLGRVDEAAEASPAQLAQDDADDDELVLETDEEEKA
jgi:large subunit ribosomal protein L4